MWAWLCFGERSVGASLGLGMAKGKAVKQPKSRAATEPSTEAPKKKEPKVLQQPRPMPCPYTVHGNVWVSLQTCVTRYSSGETAWSWGHRQCAQTGTCLMAVRLTAGEEEGQGVELGSG